MSGLSTEGVLTLMQEVADEVITPRFRQLLDHDVHEKSPGSLVTIADHEAEVALTSALLAAYPGAVVLGEEAYAEGPSLFDRYAVADHAFTVDPVDGTRNFVEGSTDHAVMIAEVVHGETTRAWIWQPALQTAWVAELRSGTYRQGERMHVTPVPAGTDPTGATSMWSLRKDGLPGLPAMTSTWMCCGVDYPRLIEGRTDFILYKRSYPWDHAPGTLLVTEAGGAVSSGDGTEYSPRSMPPGIIVARDAETLHAVRPKAEEAFRQDRPRRRVGRSRRSG